MLRGFKTLYTAELQDCGERFGGCKLVTRSFLGLCRACREASKSDGASSVHNVDWSCLPISLRFLPTSCSHGNHDEKCSDEQMLSKC